MGAADPGPADDPRVGWQDDGVASVSAAPPPLVLVTGDEELLVERAITRVLAAARKVEPETERRQAPAAGLTPAEFADLVAPSLFAEPRVVVVTGAQESTKDLASELLAYVRDPVDAVTVVVHHAGGARNKALADGFRKAGAHVVTCDRITKAGERADFVRQEIRQAGGTTSPDAVAALIDSVGTDLRELAAAAGQLVADTGGLVD